MSATKYRIEAALFEAGRSMTEQELEEFIGDDESLTDILLELAVDYDPRGVQIVQAAGGWSLRTKSEASDLTPPFSVEPERLTRAAMETLAAIACFQPVTRSEVERIRGVQLSPGVMMQILEASLIKPGPRRETPGRPLTWAVTTEFLESYDLMSIEDLPSYRRAKEAGLLVLPQMPTSAGDEG